MIKNMNDCKIVIKLVLLYQLDRFASLSKMWLPEQFKLDSTKVLSTGLIVSICLAYPYPAKRSALGYVPTFQQGYSYAYVIARPTKRLF